MVSKLNNMITATQQNMDKKLAILTSGGDSQGMNAATRAIVRAGLTHGAKCFIIREGYEGLIKGDNHISSVGWYDVSGIIQTGGTVIGSARCKKFRDRAGRKQAAKNLLTNGISNLCVIGGDGSLTGADLFRKEWPEFIKEFIEEDTFSDNELTHLKQLHVVGLVGSIDNDFCGTDMTIGADSALHRIAEAINNIQTTAFSHQRVFILEVMGRHCGYLALCSAIGCGADWVFLPEAPPKDNWPEQLKAQLNYSKEIGERRTGIIILAEGAIQRDGTKITSQDLMKILGPSYDTRITVLGHVQRGGNTSAFDRILATRLGIAAAEALIDADEDKDMADVIILKQNKIVRKSLNELVELTKQAQQALLRNDFESVIKLRGGSFKGNFNMFKMLSKIRPREVSLNMTKKRIGILSSGAPCAGMNSIIRTAVICCLNSERADPNVYIEPVIIYDGLDGLLAGKMEPWALKNVIDTHHIGGVGIGTNRSIPTTKTVHRYMAKIIEYQIDGLVMIGGFEAFNAATVFQEYLPKYLPKFKAIVIPATISNNLPGTDICIGADTALNAISLACDRVKLSASGSRRRVFIVEVMGRRSGYLATMGSISAGADAAYIFEEKIKLTDLCENVQRLKAKMSGPVKRGIVLLANEASINYTSDFFRRLYTEEGNEIFETKVDVLGYIQQGETPTPFDRKFATILTYKAMRWMLELNESNDQYNSQQFNYGIIGAYKSAYTVSPLTEINEQADHKNRIPKNAWWLPVMRPILKMMSHHPQEGMH